MNAIRGSMSLTDVIVYAISSIVVIFLTLPIHEWAHGFTATKLGDPTPRYQGRLTLNPFAHIDYLGAALILIFGFGWAKPVQINSRYFKNPKRDMAITALAGPVSNLIVALIAMLLFYLMQLIFASSENVMYVLCVFFRFIASINISLAVFNLIPIPPLDGSRLLSAFLPDRAYYRMMQYERYFFIAIILLLWTGILSYPINFLYNYIFKGINFIAFLPFRAFIY